MSLNKNNKHFTSPPSTNNMMPPMPSMGTFFREGLQNANIVGAEVRYRWMAQNGDQGKLNGMKQYSFQKDSNNAGK
uniref:Uncharacterized protein n=1 Tax=Strongyloides venezuelensis TaxID=75913 RepID=A0A0K0FEA9_STRVS